MNAGPLPTSADNAIDRFSAAKSARHKSRLAGMNPHYWYPAEWSERVGRGKPVETKFWGDSIALFRGDDGRVGAVENRCAHRHIKLTLGRIEGCKLSCLYHGWQYDREGRLVGMHHDDFGKKLPKVQLRHYPVRERYGLVWIFPGDPAIADSVPLPEVLHADGPEEWASLRFDYTWKAHHHMVMDNLCNLTHLYVHGRWVPYDKTTLPHHSLTEGERIKLVWQHTMRKDLLYPVNALVFLKSFAEKYSDTVMTYDYPYQSAVSNSRIRSCNFMLPIDDTHTRVFSIQLWRGFKIPGIGLQLPTSVMNRTWVPLVKNWTVEVFRQDGATVEAEQEALAEHFERPIPEPNPSVKLFEKVTIDRWEKQLSYLRGEITAAQAGPGARAKLI